MVLLPAPAGPSIAITGCLRRLTWLFRLRDRRPAPRPEFLLFVVRIPPAPASPAAWSGGRLVSPKAHAQPATHSALRERASARQGKKKSLPLLPVPPRLPPPRTAKAAPPVPQRARTQPLRSLSPAPNGRPTAKPCPRARCSPPEQYAGAPIAGASRAPMPPAR